MILAKEKYNMNYHPYSLQVLWFFWVNLSDKAFSKQIQIGTNYAFFFLTYKPLFRVKMY